VVLRVDRTDVDSRLGKFVRNGAGAVRVPATISRTGLQTYTKDGKPFIEYRPASEVFAPESLASLAGVPVTLRHPNQDVTRDNARDVQVGHASDLPPEAHVKVDGSADEWVRAPLYIADGGVQDAIERGEAGTISCGYSCELEMCPTGTAPDGTKCDAIQRAIRFNHVAILTTSERPRAGGEARLRLDSQGKPMKLITIDGVELEYGSDKHIAKLQSDSVAAVAVQSARADKAEAERDTQKERADKAELAVSPDKIDSLVEARMSLLARAAKLLPGTYETKGKSDAQVRADAVAAKIGADKITGKSEAYVEARFDSLTDADAPAVFHKPAARADGAAPSTNNDSDEAFRAALVQKDSK
jgi:hypothetical protein